MPPVHGACVEDRELLIQLALQELKNAGITACLDTPRPGKKALVPFSTPGGSSGGGAGGGGALRSADGGSRIFGRQLSDISKLLVGLDSTTDLLVPNFVVGACNYIKNQVTTEGLYRMAGSAARQKLIRRELETGNVDFDHLDPTPSVLDVASLLKQFLRELPQSVLPTGFHPLLAQCLAADPKDYSSLFTALLLLPPENLSCLSYLCRHFADVASASPANKMTTKNLAIVITPSIFPIQNCQLAPGKMDRRGGAAVEMVDNSRLTSHTAIVEVLILRAHQVGFVPGEVYEKYMSCHAMSAYSTCTSEDNLDDDSSAVGGPSKRRAKKNKQHIRRRSGSLSRVLSVMGKGIRAMARTAGGGGNNSGSTPHGRTDSVHSTPLPMFGATPDFSPRAQVKRKASEDSELSPSSKTQKRCFESTFTPKMRSRTFSVKRFKRKKSGSKLPAKETLAVSAKSQSFALPAGEGTDTDSANTTHSTQANGYDGDASLYENMSCGPATAALLQSDYVEPAPALTDSVVESEYAEVRAQYEELKMEVSRLEGNRREQEEEKEDDIYETLACVEEGTEGDKRGIEQRYEEALASGTLSREGPSTARHIANVRRRSSESKKPRSPSLRRIGVIRRRSREREAKEAASAAHQRLGTSTAAERRSRSPGPARRSPRSPVGSSRGVTVATTATTPPATKPALTPLNLDRPLVLMKGGRLLQRGQPNSVASGLEKPSPVVAVAVGADGQARARIKMSFKGGDRRPRVMQSSPTPDIGASGASSSSSRSVTTTPVAVVTTKAISHSDSIASLRNDISEIIENSLGSSQSTLLASSSSSSSSENPSIPPDQEDDCVFLATTSSSGRRREEELPLLSISAQLAGVTFRSPAAEGHHQQQQQLGHSPLTRTQLRRQSDTFDFVRPSERRTGEEELSDVSSLRRQSSAFEFRSRGDQHQRASQRVEPVYENLRRDATSRASLRRRNSSVKDLVERLEAEAKKRTGISSLPPSHVLPAESATGRRSNSAASRNTTVKHTETSRPRGFPPAPSPGTLRAAKPASSVTATLPPPRLRAPSGSAGGLTATPVRNRQAVAAAPTASFDGRRPLGSTSLEDNSEELWMDASEFFRTATHLLPESSADAAGCGRSSVIRIRQENRGRVFDSVVKFSGPESVLPATTVSSTPVRPRVPVSGTRRMSARMGVAANMTPVGAVAGQISSSAATGTRRQTLTGIRTSAAGRTPTSSATTVLPLASSRTATSAAVGNSRPREKSPQALASCRAVASSRQGTVLPPPPKQRAAVSGSSRATGCGSLDGVMNKRSPAAAAATSKMAGGKRSPRLGRATAGITGTGGKMANEAPSTASSGSNMRKNNVRRAASNVNHSNRRQRGESSVQERRREERRYLTIGYPGEVTRQQQGEAVGVRSPLRECQNIQANVKRSNSDQTPSRKEQLKAAHRDTENLHYQNVAVVARTHSLKSDVLMSPRPSGATLTPRTEKVRRALSDRTTTPRSTPYIRLPEGSSQKPRPRAHHGSRLEGTDSPRRSPRFLTQF